MAGWRLQMNQRSKLLESFSITEHQLSHTGVLTVGLKLGAICESDRCVPVCFLSLYALKSTDGVLRRVHLASHIQSLNGRRENYIVHSNGYITWALRFVIRIESRLSGLDSRKNIQTRQYMTECNSTSECRKYAEVELRVLHVLVCLRHVELVHSHIWRFPPLGLSPIIGAANFTNTLECLKRKNIYICNISNSDN